MPARSPGCAGWTTAPKPRPHKLTAAVAAHPWLASGSQTVQQQATGDLDQAWRGLFAESHRRATWRKAGRHTRLRIVGPQALRVRRGNQERSGLLVPKIGWARFKAQRRTG